MRANRTLPARYRPLPSPSQVWKDGAKVEELVGAAKDRLKGLVEKHA